MDDEPSTMLITRFRTCAGCGGGVLVMADEPAPTDCEEHNRWRRRPRS